MVSGTASEVLKAMVAMFASGDPSEAADVVAEDYLDHQGLGAGPIEGVEGFARVVRTNHAAYTRQEISIEDLFGVEDRAVARIRWRGQRSDGEVVDRETIDIIRVAEGRAVEHWGARAERFGVRSGAPMVEEAETNWLETNRRLWDEMSALHPSTVLYDVEGLVAGRDDLRPWEDDEMGPLAGLDVVHLQCHIGTDTIGLARRGARVVGIDFSAEAIIAARQLSARCGLDVEWVQANVYDAVDALGERAFDVVYTGIGAIGWLPDLTSWAQVVRGLLKPGGVLYLVELHPMWVAMIVDGTTICQDALGAAYTRWDEQERVSYADPGRPLSSVSSFERLHAISEVLTAVLEAGLSIELFHEFDVTPAPTPWLEPRGDRLYGFPEGMARFPLTFSLRARRPPA